MHGRRNQFVSSCEADCQVSSASKSPPKWLKGINQQFQKAAYPHVKSAWDMAVGTDMRFKGSTINEPYGINVMQKVAVGYLMELFKLAGTDVVVRHSIDITTSWLAFALLVLLLLQMK